MFSLSLRELPESASCSLALKFGVGSVSFARSLFASAILKCQYDRFYKIFHLLSFAHRATHFPHSLPRKP